MTLEEIMFDCEHARLHGLWIRSESSRVVLMFTGFTDSHATHLPLARALRKDYNIFLVTLNCHAKSNGPFDVAKMVTNAGNVREVILQRKFDFFGEFDVSLGGMVGGISAAISNYHPDALCLAATGSCFADYYPILIARAGMYLPSALSYRLMLGVNWLLTHVSRKGWNTPGPIIYDSKEKCYRLGALRVSSLAEIAQGVVMAPKLLDVAHHLPLRMPIYVIMGGDDKALSLKTYRKPTPGTLDVVYNDEHYFVKVPKRLLTLWEKLDATPQKGNLLLLPGRDHSCNPIGSTRMSSRFMDPLHDARIGEIYSKIKDFFDSCSPLKQSGRSSAIYP